MDKFEQWFKDQNFYTNMRFIHGDGLFVKDGEVYRVLPVQMAWEAWQSRQAEVDELAEHKQTLLQEIDGHMHQFNVLSKRIAELEMWIKDQIETLKCASKSWVYTEREQNLMLSQADDLEKALRGEHE